MKRIGIGMLSLLAALGASALALRAQEQAPPGVTNKAATTGPAAIPSPQPAKPSVDLPTELAAYVLHSRYIYGANGGQSWYWGKTVTVAGVVDSDEIKRITSNSLFDQQYAGQYAVPLLGNKGFYKVVCVAPYSAKLDALLPKKTVVNNKIHNHATKRFRVVKFTGKVMRGEHGQQVLIVDAAPLSFRTLSGSRKREMANKSRPKSAPQDPDDDDVEIPNASGVGRTVYTANLDSTSDLERWCWIVLGRGANRRICDMGADPEGYAAELACLFKNRDASQQILVKVSGIADRAGSTSRLKDCRIVGWRVTDAKEMR